MRSAERALVFDLMTKAGLVAVVGKPNTGKSTLLNRLVGEKLSITSEKPQSTRNRVAGILTKDDVQMIVLDTPGLLEPRYALQRAMHATSRQALNEADVIVYLADARDGTPPPLRKAAELERDPHAPVVLVLNKIDAVRSEIRKQLRRDAPDALQVSALTGEGVDELVREISKHLPESPFLYPDDEIGTQPLRFFASELVRETALEQLEDEVPYSVACAIEEFREDRSPVYVRAVIYVERESQKAILLGHRGARIRDLGRASRVKIERLVGKPVYLDLWVKVLPNWRRNAQSLRRLGYTLPEERRR